MNFIPKLQLSMERLEREYEKNGMTTWTEYKADPGANAKKVVELTQADFADGTLRVTAPCKLVLTEDISFNPNPGELKADGKLDPARTSDWFPKHNQSEYAGIAAFHLGFFAAITVEAEGVIIDLNRNAIAMSKEFALMQQFYSHIELADQPFETSQGPAEFGPKLRGAQKCWIKDGSLGYTSHHQIHGNRASDILITDVVMRDGAVAAIALNGSRRVAVMDCEYQGTRLDFPVKGQFNDIRLGVKVLDGYMGNPGNGPLPEDTQNAYDAAKLAVEGIFDDVIADGYIQPGTLSAADASVLQNTLGTDGESLYFDGISYGFLFNAVGDATGPFTSTRDSKSNDSSEIAVLRCTISEVETEARELLALSPAIEESQELDVGDEVQYDVNAQMRGPTGSILQFLKAFKLDLATYPVGNPERGQWAGNVVADLQCELAQLQSDLSANQPLAKSLGQINIEPEFIKMKRAKGTGTGSDVYRLATVGEAESPIEGDKVYILFTSSALDGEVEPTDGRDLHELEFVVLAAGDAQHHVLKGLVGLRIEGVTDATLEDITLAGIEQNSALGYGYRFGDFQDPLKPSNSEMGYIGDKDGGHGGQGSQVGYSGNHSRGVSIRACSNIRIKNLKVVETAASTGPAIAIDVAGESSDISMENVEIKEVVGGAELTPVEVKAMKKHPNWPPTATGVIVDDSCTNVSIKDVRVSGLAQPIGSPREMDIRSTSTKLK